MGPPIETVNFMTLPEVPGADVLSVRDSSRLWRIYHETYTVCTVLPETPGRSEWTYRGKYHEAARNQLMIMEPGEFHVTQRVTNRGSFEVLFLKPSILSELLSSLGCASLPHMALAETSHPRVVDAMLRFHRSLAARPSQLEVESRLMKTLHTLVSHCAEKKPPLPLAPSESILRRAKNFLCDQWDRNVSLGELAGVSGLSKFHFLRSFCRLFGLPPHAYQIHMRLAKARELLRKGVPVSDMELGFSDQSHFIRHFKRNMGLTPGQYARMVRRPMVLV